jgi:mannose/cellobiose epimerase-like protein (N-acyl-D-glucosamine 2-epimerase family)
LTELATAARAHLLDELLPLWARHGLDRKHGGCWSRLGPDLQPLPDGRKRMLVQARQVYAFTRGAELGAGPFAREAAEHALEFLIRRFWDPRHGGWYALTDDAGAPLDRRKDLYDHAFAIFALAHHARVARSPDSLRRAHETLELVRARLADPIEGGFLEGASESWEPFSGPRRQNPHMHLFEALLALHEAAPDGSLVREAGALLELLESRWVDSTTGVLGEHFDPAWRPLSTEAGDVVEPGHHFEWAWLLDRFATLAPESTAARALSERLFVHAETHGVDADGGVFDQIRRDGRTRLYSKRLWPQTERVKALASRLHAQRGPARREALERALRHCFVRYRQPTTGGWNEQLDRAGTPIGTAQNATSVYHVVFALGEAHAALGPETR